MVDTAISPPITPNLAAADDSGTSDSDDITNQTTGLTFSGTAEANATVKLYRGAAVLLDTTTADGSGNWSADATLPEANNDVYATATDVAGNTSSSSGSLQVTIDTTPPDTPVTLTPYQGENTGDNLQPKFSWTDILSETYDLQVDDNSAFVSPEIDQTGIVSTQYTPASDMTAAAGPPAGTRYYFRVRSQDTAGNQSNWSSTISPLRYANVGRFDDDFDGDGYGDLAASAPQNDTGGTDAGAVYIYHGGPTGMDTGVDITITGGSSWDEFGTSVASAGDLNGDGYADLVIGVPRDGSDAGAVYIYEGGISMDAIADFTVTGSNAGDKLGTSVD